MEQKVRDLRSALKLLESMPGQLIETDVEVDPMAELAHAKCDIRARIIRRVRWRRNQLIEVKIWICCLMHHLLTRCIAFKIDRWNWILHTFAEHLSKIFRLSVK